VLFAAGGLFLDFFDGFAARLLGVAGDLGKQLDSLADMVTFGVFPGLLLWHAGYFYFNAGNWAFAALFIPLMSAYRLAKFNLDTRQSDQFLGLPTPAATLLIGSWVYVGTSHISSFWSDLLLQNWIYPVLASAIGALLVSEIPLIALKFKSFQIKNNITRYLLLVVIVLLIAILGLKSAPFIIPLYLGLSLIDNAMKRQKQK
jgi:CDP-diacylglycerol--serine O-phosphatidyltransferase